MRMGCMLQHLPLPAMQPTRSRYCLHQMHSNELYDIRRQLLSLAFWPQCCNLRPGGSKACRRPCSFHAGVSKLSPLRHKTSPAHATRCCRCCYCAQVVRHLLPCASMRTRGPQRASMTTQWPSKPLDRQRSSTTNAHSHGIPCRPLPCIPYTRLLPL